MSMEDHFGGGWVVCLKGRLCDAGVPEVVDGGRKYVGDGFI